jgi:hypothetical protein
MVRPKKNDQSDGFLVYVSNKQEIKQQQGTLTKVRKSAKHESRTNQNRRDASNSREASNGEDASKSREASTNKNIWNKGTRHR